MSSRKPSNSQATWRGAMPKEFESHIKMRVHDYGGFQAFRFVLVRKTTKNGEGT